MKERPDLNDQRERGSARSRRVTFYAEPDVHEVLQLKQRGEVTPFLNHCVRAVQHPGLSLQVPGDDDDMFLDDILPHARHDIILLGLTLNRIIERYGDLLRHKVQEHVQVTASILNHELGERDPAYLMLGRLLRRRPYVDIVRERASQSLAFLRSLKREGLDSGTTVRILRYADLPPYGLVIRDHRRSNSGMRLNIFNIPSMDRLHPFLDIDPATVDGRVAYETFYEYYQELLSRDVVEDGA